MLSLVRATFACTLLLGTAVPLFSQNGGVDPTRLPIGDGKVSNAPKQGFVWSCNAAFPGRGGAHSAGPWIKADGTYDFTAKPTVDGAVTWPHSFTIQRRDSVRRLSGNDLPNHPTGVFPIARSDDAFNFDRNPNPISAQNFTLDMPANPAVARNASCLPMGPVGVLLTGGYFFNALDLRGEDAVAHEIQDSCQGHPQNTGAYHYHNLSSCVDDSGSAHSKLVGYAFDGFGVFGKRGENGRLLTNADLDECHGHAHEIPWDDRTVPLYHYHATWEYPYTIGCFRGSPAQGSGLQGRGGRGRGAGPPPPQQPPPQSSISLITLGTGSPRYDSARAGPANAIRVGDRYIIVDAGNGAQARLHEAQIPGDRIDAILITHHHLDHDQELVPLVITLLVRGNAPQIIGSPGTVDMMNFLRSFYAEDIRYRMGRAPATDIDPGTLRVRDVSGGESFSIGAVNVRTARVNHTIHTVAYRLESGGRSIVISGDLTFSQSLIDLARGADVMVIDSGQLPGDSTVSGGGRPMRAGRGGADGRAAAAGRAGRAAAPDQGARAHPTFAEVASMASQAGVRCLVLSHITQTAIDHAATLEQFRASFPGKVVIASDLMEVTPSCETRMLR